MKQCTFFLQTVADSKWYSVIVHWNWKQNWVTLILPLSGLRSLRGSIVQEQTFIWKQIPFCDILTKLEGLFFTVIIIIHSFYIALFSARKQTHCAHWHVILNEWLYPFIACIINIHGSGGLIALFGCCMAGATWNAAISAQVLCTTFNHAPGYSVTSFKAT